MQLYLSGPPLLIEPSTKPPLRSRTGSIFCQRRLDLVCAIYHYAHLTLALRIESFLRFPGQQQGYSAKLCIWPCHCSVVIARHHRQDPGDRGCLALEWHSVPASCIFGPFGGKLNDTGAKSAVPLDERHWRNAESPSLTKPKIARFSLYHETSRTQDGARTRYTALFFSVSSLGHIRSAAAYAGGSMAIVSPRPTVRVPRARRIVRV